MQCTMRRRILSMYRLPLVIMGCVSCGMVLWQIGWMVLARWDLPIHFDASLLQDFEYLGAISELDKSEPLGRYGYSIVASREMSPLRKNRDTRHVQCKSITSSVRHELPSTTVIITFTNVDRSVLLRNVVSVLTKSGSVTIVEIILVDDGSENEEDGRLLSKLPGVKVIRNEQKKGRGLARMQGVAMANGEVIAFLDALVEVNTEWLSPLVLRLTQFPRSIASPVVDSIDHVTFEYHSLPGLYRGAFDWNLQYHWEEMPARDQPHDDPTDPFRTPTLNGNVFAVRRDFFDSLGGYDPNPGARETEDLEFSLRAWMCGGQIEIVPCSRVGVVRAKSRDLVKQGMSFNSHVRSARRVAEIWLDEYKRFFYSTRPTSRMQLLSDISSQRKLKERLKCKTFKWFLTTIYPQLQPIVNDELAYGYIRQDSECIDVDPGQLPLVAKLRACQADKNSQEWSWRKRGVIVSNGMCLTADLMNMQGFVSVQFCKDIDTQIWYRHKEKIVHQDTNLCLDGHQGHTGLVISDCIQDEASQAWLVEREGKVKAAHSNGLDNDNDNDGDNDNGADDDYVDRIGM